MNLHIGKAAADGSAFDLPVEAVTATIAILAMKGKGKTYTSSVLAEEMLRAGQSIIVIDYTGAWYGLKSSADGNKVGFPVVIFGGEHADLALEPTAGEVVARAIVEGRFSAIIDMTLFRKAEGNRFLGEFLETLYRVNRQAVHLFCDEADAYAPQKPQMDQARTLGAMEDIVRRGRVRGIGCTLITQRPAVLNKNVLTQCECLIALGLSHNLDIKAIREWVEVNGAGDQEDLMMKDLPSLQRGRAYVWAPSWNVFSKVIVRQRTTFDSSATPKPGQTKVEPKSVAVVDIPALGQQIQRTIEITRENDPKFLKAEVQRLKTELAKKPVATAPEIREVPMLNDADRAVLQHISDEQGKISGWLSDIRFNLVQYETATGRFSESIRELNRRIHSGAPIAAERVAPLLRADPSESVKFLGTPMPMGERVILIACAQFNGCDRPQLTALTGYKKSSRDTYISRLQAKGYVEVNGIHISATTQGLHALGSFQPLPTGDALRAYWYDRLPEGERKVLEALSMFFPASVARDVISQRTGYLKSSRDTYISRLNARKLVTTVKGGVVASAALFS